MLSVEGLEVRYGSTPAVRGVSLHIDAGEVIGLIGPNGAGKTTTLSAIFGLVRPASGDITFDGTRLNGLTPEAIVRHGLALVPEGRHIFGSLTVSENLLLGTTPRPDRRGYRSELKEIFARFPILERYFDTPAARLSGGEQQQLAIGRALLSRPRLLLLDEPSLGLAPKVVDLVFEALAELRADGVTVLLVEQKAARTVAFADRTYVLRDGTVRHSGTRDELRNRLDLAHAYLGLREEG
jgi:branched-chain amino acid transport system ATP-binding protein